MNVRLLALLSLLALPAWAQQPTRVVTWTQALNAPAPTTSTVGCIGGTQTVRALQLDSLLSYRITLQLNGTGTLGTVGSTYMPYLFDVSTGAWSPDWVDAITIAGGAASETLPQQDVRVASGCIYYVGLNITVNGGTATTLTTTVTAIVRTVRQ
jgi:hypothetical protein